MESSLKKGVEMTAAVLRDECAVRFRDALLAAVPSMARKRVARVLSVSPETVDGWIDCQAPQLPASKHLLAAFAAFGPGFTAHVLFPCGNWVRALSIGARTERLRREIEELRVEVAAIGTMDSPVDLVRQIEVALAASQKALARARETNS